MVRKIIYVGKEMDSSKLRLRRKDSVFPIHHGNSRKPSPSPKSHRRRKSGRRRSLIVAFQAFLKAACATIISACLSLSLLPFSWTQVDYNHQVQNEFQHLYQVMEQNRQNHITGIRGSHNKSRQIVCPNGLIGFLNDDYCDCDDGSDEPLTSACSHLMIQKPVFFCKSDQSVRIYASRVHDGIKDCPDGSD